MDTFLDPTHPDLDLGEFLGRARVIPKFRRPGDDRTYSVYDDPTQILHAKQVWIIPCSGKFTFDEYFAIDKDKLDFLPENNHGFMGLLHHEIKL